MYKNKLCFHITDVQYLQGYQIEEIWHIIKDIYIQVYRMYKMGLCKTYTTLSDVKWYCKV